MGNPHPSRTKPLHDLGDELRSSPRRLGSCWQDLGNHLVDGLVAAGALAEALRNTRTRVDLH